MRWVDKEMGGLEMWKAQRIEAGRCRGRRREGAEDEDGKAQRTRRKRQQRTKTGKRLRMEAERREGS